jgi:LPXTG-site transpeptidase (sortase) family protein
VLSRVGNVLIGLGGLLLLAAVGWQLGLVPGSRVTLPEPVALQRRATAAPAAVAPTLAAAEPAPTVGPIDAVPTPVARPTPAPVVVSAPAPAVAVLPTAPPAPAPTAVAGPAYPEGYTTPDSADRRAEAALPLPGYAVRLAIPAIHLDTPVEQAGIVRDDQGQPQWETRPFVAVHYGDLTARVGARGNAVIAGHVVTRTEGNVFRELYKVDFGDEIQVWDDHEHLHEFRVVDVELVPPSDTAPMAPTTDRTLTLITCGGTFDPIKREFSDRLIVTAKPRIEDPRT